MRASFPDWPRSPASLLLYRDSAGHYISQLDSLTLPTILERFFCLGYHFYDISNYIISVEIEGSHIFNEAGPLIYGNMLASDAVDFNRQVSAIGWDLEFLSLEPNPAPLTIEVAQTEKIAVQKVFFSGRLHQIGASPKGFLTIGLQTQCNNILKFGNRYCGPDDLMNFNSNVGLDTVTERGHRAFTISISQDHLEEHIDSQELLGASVADFRHRSCSTSDPNDHLQLQRSIAEMLELARTGASKELLDQEADVTGLFLETWFDSARTSPYRYGGRSRRLGRVIDYIYANLDQSPSIAHICRECAIGRKTLERDFKSHLGVSPKQYVNLLRLSAVRRDLLLKSSETTIQEIALTWGFNHMGKFAADYARNFGELPSVTRGYDTALFTSRAVSGD